MNTGEGNTIIRDNPGCLWFVAGMFLFVGTIFVLGPLGLFTNNAEVPLWTRGLAFVMGLVGAGTGAWLLWSTPSVATTVDVRRRRVIILERGLAGRRERELAAGEIADVIVAETPDSDGDTTYQPHLILRSGEHVALSRVWLSARASSERHVLALRRALAHDLGVDLPEPRP